MEHACMHAYAQGKWVKGRPHLEGEDILSDGLAVQSLARLQL